MKYRINYKILTLYLCSIVLLACAGMVLIEPTEAVLPEYSKMSELESDTAKGFSLMVLDADGAKKQEYVFLDDSVMRAYIEGSASNRILLPESTIKTLSEDHPELTSFDIVEYEGERWIRLDLTRQNQGTVALWDDKGISICPVRLSAGVNGLILQPWRTEHIERQMDTDNRLILVSSKYKYTSIKMTLIDVVKSGLKSSHKVLNVNKEIVPELTKMLSASKKKGYQLTLVSGYRSVEKQSYIFNEKVKALKRAKVKSPETVAAKTIQRPGYSEHHTGYAVDILTNKILSTSRFYGTKEAAWLESHAHEYGFIIRYPKGKTAITGISHEPWHLRYVGHPYATWLKESKKTLEELIEGARQGIVIESDDGVRLLYVADSKSKGSYNYFGGDGFVCKKINISDKLVGYEVFIKRQEKIEKITENVTVN